MNKPLLATPYQIELAVNSKSFHTHHTDKQNYHANLAIIPVEGLLLHRSEMYGSSYEGIRSQLNQALNSPHVEHILLDIDSGGGEINGLFDLVDDIVAARSQKPITALVNECACSAAYLIASGAQRIVAPRTAIVGSIGVIVTHLDQSEAEKKIGLKFTEVYAGTHKNGFSLHQPLSETAKEDLQNQVDETYELFIQTLAKNRGQPEILFRSTEAKVYSSTNALKLQLIDHIQPANKFIEEILMSEDLLTQQETIPDHVKLVQKERERIKGILNLCKLAKQSDLVTEFVENGSSIDEVRKLLFDQLVANAGDPINNAVAEKPTDHQHLIKSMVQGLGG
ncbi:MAG: S49 family peptidase [Candidatus Berkiella sp.]